MELLNNLWTALNTSNPLLVSILSIPLIFFMESPLSFSLICNIFKINYTKKQKYIYILSTATIALICNFFIPSPYNVILNYGSAIILVYSLFKLNIIKTLIASLLPSILFSLVGNLIFNPFLSLFNLTFEEATTTPIYRIPFALCMYLIIYLLSLTSKYLNVSINILDDVDKKNKSTITLNFLFGLLYIIFEGVLTSKYIDILPIQFTLFNFLCLLIYFAVSFYSLIKVMKLFTTEKKLESVEEYNKTLHILHDNVRGFKHDFDNIVTTIGGYVKTNDIKGLEKYYSQLQEDCEKVNNLYILNPDIINSPGIYNLLTRKYSKAEEKGIKVNLTFLLDLNDINMKIYEFARILGILLDNSIEATSECDKKIINIVFRNDTKNNRSIILIENTYKNKDVDLQQIFDKGISEKENHTGLGLWEIKQILKKNNNINLNTTKNEEYFSQQLEIYY